MEPFNQSSYPPVPPLPPRPPLRSRRSSRSVWTHPALIVTYTLVPVLLVIGMVGVVLPAAGWTITLPGLARTTPTPTTLADRPAPSELPSADEYAVVLDGEWTEIADHPDDHIGEGYDIYGWVTQSDDDTGSDLFRADTGGEVEGCFSYEACDYEENAILVAGEWADFTGIVEDVEFSANVTVLGTYEYDTKAGRMAAPYLQVDAIAVV